MSILLFVWKKIIETLFTNCFFLIHLYTQSMHLLGHPAYMKMWIILLKMIYIFWN